MKSAVSYVKEQPDFFVDLQEKFLGEVGDMGFDILDIKDLIEEHGIPEYSHNLCIDALSNKPQYKNALMPPKNRQQHNPNLSINQISMNLNSINQQQHLSMPP